MGTQVSNPNYQQVTVDVPEDRLAEFHAFFARFLAGRPGRGRGARHHRPHRGMHGHGRRCGARHEADEPAAETTGTPAETTQL